MCAAQATERGLSEAEAAHRVEQHGYNEISEASRNPVLVYLGYLWNPLSWAMEAAAILAIILLDYADFCLIIALLFLNATIRQTLFSYHSAESLADSCLILVLFSCQCLHQTRQHRSPGSIPHAHE